MCSPLRSPAAVSCHLSRRALGRPFTCLLLLALGAAGCANGATSSGVNTAAPAPSPTAEADATNTTATGRTGGDGDGNGAVAGAGAAAPAGIGPAGGSDGTPSPSSDSAASGASSSAAAVPEPSLELAPSTALDFTTHARALFRVVACANNDTLPTQLDAARVDAHCAKLSPVVDKLQNGWLASAKPFLAGLRPPQLPDRVVYPFGGGDLLWALTTFPDAREYTTISLETAGDPRGIEGLDNTKLAASYKVAEKNITLQFRVSHSRTDNLTIGARDLIPTELVLDLMALRVYGFEPVGLSYFQIEADGSLRYLTAEELRATPADQQPALFSNMELVFRPAGAPAGERTRVLRHMAVDLSDSNLTSQPGLLRHLERKGKVAAMTKAASYLLWSSAFGKIRDYMLQNMAWMISDSTGISPKAASTAGFVQDTYGRFEAPFLADANKEVAQEFVALWKSQRHRDVPIIYGYPDGNHHWHLLVTRPATPAQAGRAAAGPPAVASQPGSASGQ